MTIKEAAKLTGLTAKTIRYYEKMGLLHVSRDKDNSYRNYSEEDEEVQSMLDEIATPSLPELIITVLIYLGPILWLFIHIADKRWDMLPLTAPLALIATVILTLSCRNYWDWRRNRSSALKRKNQKDKKEMKKVLLSIFFGVVIVILSVIVLTHLAETWLAPEGWLFYEIQSSDILIALLPLMAIIFFTDLTDSLLSRGKIHIKRVVLCLLILLTGTYMCFTNTVFVTDDSIVCCSPLEPTGKSYKYEDISKIEAKFGTRRLSLNEDEKSGSFQYAIYLDGEKYVFSVPSVNSDIERYLEDTYLELEEFDSALMALNIPKKSSDAGSEYCDLDDRYRDRFLRIIQ